MQQVNAYGIIAGQFKLDFINQIYKRIASILGDDEEQSSKYRISIIKDFRPYNIMRRERDKSSVSNSVEEAEMDPSDGTTLSAKRPKVTVSSEIWDMFKKKFSNFAENVIYMYILITIFLLSIHVIIQYFGF